MPYRQPAPEQRWTPHARQTSTLPGDHPRKLGHVNVLGADLADLRRRAGLAAGWLGSGIWPDGYQVHGRRDDDGERSAT